LKQPNDEFGAYRWSDGGGVDDKDGRGRHDWSHSGLRRYKNIMTKVKESSFQYDFDQTHEGEIDRESEEKSLLVRFREGYEKWTKVHIKNGRDNLIVQRTVFDAGSSHFFSFSIFFFRCKICDRPHKTESTESTNATTIIPSTNTIAIQ